MKRLLLLCLLFTACSENPVETQALYDAWLRANPTYAKMTFDDWRVLRAHDMLPGVDYATMYAKKAKAAAESAQINSSVNLSISAGNSK